MDEACQHGAKVSVESAGQSRGIEERWQGTETAGGKIGQAAATAAAEATAATTDLSLGKGWSQSYSSCLLPPPPPCALILESKMKDFSLM